MDTLAVQIPLAAQPHAGRLVGAYVAVATSLSALIRLLTTLRDVDPAASLLCVALPGTVLVIVVALAVFPARTTG